VIRVVVDPGVFISVLIGSRGSPPDRIFSAWIDDRLEVVASPQLIAELRRVLLRPRFRRWFDETSAQPMRSSVAIEICTTPNSPTYRCGRRDILLTFSANSDQL
jgi:putative PIN family toxin of toxin-antitoxin system